MPSCPQCCSNEFYKDGMRYTTEGQIQRFLCRSCGFRFSEPNVKVNVRCKVSEASEPGQNSHKGRVVAGSRAVEESANGFSFLLSEDVCSHNLSSVAKGLNALPFYSSNHRVCATTKGAKNLETTTIQKVAGENAETQTQQDIKGKLVQFIWQMQKDNYSKDTITTYSGSLQRLISRGCNILDPEAVKETLAKMRATESYKYIIASAYTLFLAKQGLKWEMPIFHINRSLPFIPTEREIDDLIAGCGKKTACYLQTLKETALRSGEAARLKWVNVDLERKMITLNDPSKSGTPRIFDISMKLVSMLTVMPKNTQYVFGTSCKITRASVFYRLRKNLARKLGNPRLLQISLHTFRHWKATTLYHETKDILLVREFLGHKSLDTTLLYIQLEKHLYKEDTDTFTVKAIRNAEEIAPLLEVGFEYVCQKDGLTFLRKRK